MQRVLMVPALPSAAPAPSRRHDIKKTRDEAQAGRRDVNNWTSSLSETLSSGHAGAPAPWQSHQPTATAWGPTQTDGLHQTWSAFISFPSKVRDLCVGTFQHQQSCSSSRHSP